MSDTAHRLAAARLWASHQVPYLASAIFAAGVRELPESGTVAVTRGWQIQADPAVVVEMEVTELGRLIVHLCGHLIRDHAGRAEAQRVREDSRAGRWNRAGDAEINDDLANDALVPVCACDTPADLGCDPGGLAEAYYQDGIDGPRRWDCGSGADGIPRPGDTGAIDRRQGELLRLKVAADIHGQPPGTVPGGWERWAETVLPSRTDWRRALAAEIRRAIALAAGAVDYSYRRPSRRAEVDPELVLPTLVQPVPEVAIVCDTSGSMHEQLLGRALAEIDAILTKAGLRRARVPVLAVDTAVHTVRRVTSARQVTLTGGGGTDMAAGISAAAELRPRPSITIVLTDGYTPWPGTPPPGMRVIAGILAQRQSQPFAGPEWARTILIDDAP